MNESLSCECVVVRLVVLLEGSDAVAVSLDKEGAATTGVDVLAGSMA